MFDDACRQDSIWSCMRPIGAIAMRFLLPTLVLIVLVLGGLYLGVLRRAAPEGEAWRAVALTGLGSGVVAAVLTLLVAVLSFTALLDAAPLEMQIPEPERTLLPP